VEGKFGNITGLDTDTYTYSVQVQCNAEAICCTVLFTAVIRHIIAVDTDPHITVGV
jgi:hypothetical protein